MKKIIAIAMCVGLILAFTACGGSSEGESAQSSASVSSEQTKAEELEKEYKGVITDYTGKLSDKAKELAEAFNKESAKYASDSAGLKSLYKGKVKDLEKVYKEGCSKLKEIQAEAKDTDENYAKQQDVLRTAYFDNKEAIIKPYKEMSKKAAEAEKKAAEAKKKAAEEKAAQEAKEKAEAEKKANEEAKKSSNNSSSNKSSEKKKEEKPDNYSIAVKYKGKNVNSLINKLGRPSSTDISNSCAETNGKEGFYYWPGVYVMAQSEEQDSPMIIKEVGRN